MPRSAVVALLAVALPLATAAPVPWAMKKENLIVNGSFEDGPKCDLLRSLPKGSTDLTGWTVTRGSIDLMGTFWEHADGKRSLDLHGSPGFGGVKQTIKTAPGATYQLTFKLSGTPRAAVLAKTLAVEIDGEQTKFTCDMTGKSGMDWQEESLTFKATGRETVIELFTLETEDPNCGPAIDDVKVMRTK
jgi:choice-of-anchor C domain-containing protein